MKTVKFTEMKNGSKEDYLLLDKLEKKYITKTGDRIINYLQKYDQTLEGYKVSRLEHSLQAATRALKDNASD
jgi:predicted HD phosphohydrolase